MKQIKNICVDSWTNRKRYYLNDKYVGKDGKNVIWFSVELTMK
jgi:hypothetical protein